MNKSRCLGLVGGLGVGAAIHYYEKLTRALEARGYVPDIVMAHAETRRVGEYLEANDRHGLAEYLNSFIRRMQAAGAELAVVPAVTPHFCVRELIAISPLPLFNIFDPFVKELKALKLKRVAVFGTRFVMDSALFGELRGLDVVAWKADEKEYIHETYMQLVRAGKGSDEQHCRLTELAHTAIRQDGVEAIILAGTDLTVLLNETNIAFPYVDCAALHIAAIVENLAA